MTARPTEPLPVIEAFLSAMGRKDYDEGLKYLAPDCQYRNIPLPGVLIGPAGVCAMLEPFFAPTIENDLRIIHAVNDGAHVFTERLDRHLLDSGWVELPVAGVWEVHDGLITAWRDYFDAATILDKWPTG